MEITKLVEITKYAQKCYDDANCKYDGHSYMKHIDMVCMVVNAHRTIFINPVDGELTEAAALLHDAVEDAKQSHSDITRVAGSEIADIVLAVTDVPEENRLLKHLLTMPKTIKDYRAIILKMCDIYANAYYSKNSGSSMYKKYVAEYAYRKPIFQLALKKYKEYLREDELELFWKELDEVHTPTLKAD